MLYVVCAIIAGGVLALDLITKYLTDVNKVDAVIIPDLLKFESTRNTGAAFSMFGSKPWARTFFLILTSFVMLCLLVAYVYCIIKKKKVSKWLGVSLALIFAGALGNFLDRLLLSSVRDFIFVFYNTRVFPAIFNVADIALVVGVIMCMVYILFLDKDAVFRIKKSSENGN